MDACDPHQGAETATTPAPRAAQAAGRRTALITGGLTLAALLPVALLSLFTYRLAASRMRELVRSGNATAATMTGELIRSDMARNIDMARALAAQPGMVAAVGRRDAEAVRERLRATVEAINRQGGGAAGARRIERVFITDPAGVEWSDYPHAPESIGKNFSDRDWYRGVSREWQPYLSDVYQRNAEPRILVVAMAAPVRDAGGQVIGIIVFQMPLAYVSESLRGIEVGGRGTGHVYVVDRRGTVVAHPTLADLQTRTYTEPAGSGPVREALSGRPSTGDYADPMTGRPMAAAFQSIPVPDGTWAAVAQQPTEDVRGPIRKLGWSIAVAGTVVAGGACVLVATLRQVSVRDRRLTRAVEARGIRLSRLADELQQAAAAERAARLESEAARAEAEAARAQAEAARADAEQAHATLRDAQGRLVQTEKLAALGQLVAGVAHEINNPLSFVLNNVAVLQRDLVAVAELIRLYQSGDEALRQRDPELMDRIRSLADDIDLPYTMSELSDLPVKCREGLARIQQIVRDLRDFARQNAIGDVQPDADVNAGIESTINIARGTVKKQKVELVSDLAPLPPVTCSPGKINQVVLNLLTNAVHASPEGGVVTVRTRPAPGGVTIQVIDHGTGIPPDVRGRIFDPFFTTKPQGEGTGLGLSISHGIVSDHGGRIDVDSEPGRGTTFTVFLPLTPPPSARGDGQRAGDAVTTR